MARVREVTKIAKLELSLWPLSVVFSSSLRLIASCSLTPGGLPTWAEKVLIVKLP